VTKEDPLYLHKILGILSLLSYAYRYFWVLPRTGNLGMKGDCWFDHATVGVHIALSTSSLIFHVLAKRIIRKPLIIWEEYRLHAIIFTMRGVSVYLFGLVRPFAGTDLEKALLYCTVMAHHLVAD
jgi:hypothetical protein